jgi:predicted transposase/invertase (TIGR01784 family)
MEERTIISFDYAIKYLLRDKADFGILSGFLTELLGREIVVVSIMESESNKADPKDKSNRVDLKARIDGGELAVFEFQFHQAVDFFGRVLYGVSKAIIEQVSAGDDIYGIKKVYSINIAYYDMGAERDYLFHGKFDGCKGVHYNNEIIGFNAFDESEDIHPEYYLIMPKKFDGKMRSLFDEWVYVLQTSTVRDDFTAAGIAEAKVKLDLLRMSPDERKRYETYLANRSSVNSALYTSELKGHAKGLAEGMEKGKAEGLAEARMEIARNLKASGMDAGEIAQITKLTVSEIAGL